MQLTHTLQFFKKRCVLQKADGYTALLSKIALQRFFFFFYLFSGLQSIAWSSAGQQKKEKKDLFFTH